jgi:CheY-like chemotaxis protein
MNKKFLVIDDDTDDRELFCEALASVDPVIICEQAVDGKEALTRLSSNGTGTPDIIFLDINMPIMDGWQFLQQLKKEDKYKEIPVIVYTTSSLIKDKRIASDLGALCFITKPHAYVRLKDMLGVIVKHVNMRNFKKLCEEVEEMSNGTN